jgi:hypothetical protein
MKRIRAIALVSIILILKNYSCYSQNISAANANSAVQNLLGEGIEVISAGFTGNPEQLSIISGAPNTLGFSNGVVITTNKRGYLQSGEPNESAGNYTINSGTSDYHLSQINGNANMNSRAYLEIAFKSTSSTISFDYVFASNEYPGYNCCQYNDAFGLFLMGPGITDYENIALIPGSTNPVTINNVNNGVPASGSGCNILNCSNVNTSFYNSSPWFYGGSTKVMTASWQVQCQEIYILKIAICNTNDPYFNSAVFIKSNSLKSEFNLGPIAASEPTICEGQDMTLTTTGSDGYVYQWSDGNGNIVETGMNLKQITVTPTVNNNVYTVSITDPGGCTLTQTITIAVHTLNNLPPWMDGINGSENYTIYVNQGNTVSFTSTLYNDNPSEQILINSQTNIPSGYSTSDPSTSGGIFSFTWATSLSTSPGIYTFTLTANDQNACEEGIGEFTFTIIVVCDHCPICIQYEDREPSGIPLPTETRAGKCIIAGISQPVKTGTADVLFRAGQEIILGDFFEAGPGFVGEIDPTVCVDDCEDCCDDWAGFTYDELPNPFYLNFSDGNPTTDFIQVTDTYHPFCAFNAKGFEFYIMDGSANIMNDGLAGELANFCCPFRSPAPENPIAHSSIWWDGYTTNIFGNKVRPADGVYFYKLILIGCNGQTEEMHGYIQILSSKGMIESGENSNGELTPASLSEQDSSFIVEAMNKREHLERTLYLYPNPTSGLVTVSGLETESVMYQLYDDKGNTLTRREPLENGEFSLGNYPPGTYYVWIYVNNTYISKKVVKI